MSEADAAVGRKVKEYAEAKQRLDTLLSQALAAAQELEATARYLRDPLKQERPRGELPDTEKISSLLDGIHAAADQKHTLGHILEQHGLDLKG